MSDNRFKIVFDGALLPGVESTTAKLNLAELFKSTVEEIEKLFTGRPVALKRDLSRPDADSPFTATAFETASGETPLLSGVLPVDDAGYLVIGDKGADLYRPK